MPLYRCRYLDRTSNVFQIQGMACENDAEAIAMARRMSANTGAAGFELWQDERWVSIWKPFPRQTAPDHRSRGVAHGRFELVGTRGALLERLLAIAFEHQVGSTPDIDLGYHATNARLRPRHVLTPNTAFLANIPPGVAAKCHRY